MTISLLLKWISKYERWYSIFYAKENIHKLYEAFYTWQPQVEISTIKFYKDSNWSTEEIKLIKRLGFKYVTTDIKYD